MARRDQRRLNKSLFGGLMAIALVLGLAANSAAQAPRLLQRTPPMTLRRAAATPSPTPAVCPSSASITVGRSVNGQITTKAPIVCYQFQGRRGDKVTLTMTKTKGTTTFDPTLELRGPRNFRVIDDVAGRDAKISQTLSGDGVYTVVASSRKNQGIGSYTLTLTNK